MKKKVAGPIFCFAIIIAVVFGTLYLIDYHQDNESVNSILAISCSAQEFYSSENGSYLEIILDDDKHTVKKIAVKDEAVIKKISETDIKEIIGVQMTLYIPEKVVKEKHLNISEDAARLLTYYKGYDEYFEIADVFFSEEHSFFDNLKHLATARCLLYCIIY